MAMATKATRVHDGESEGAKRVAAAATADELMAQAQAEMNKMSQEGCLRAACIYYELAKAGNTQAMIRLGDCYLVGEPSYLKDHKNAVWKRKPKKAVEWFKKAQRAGNVEGLYRHALCHLDGSGVGLDKGKATYLLKQAADKGSDKAFHALGHIYGAGACAVHTIDMGAIMRKVQQARGTAKETELRDELRRRKEAGTASDDAFWWECMPGWREP